MIKLSMIILSLCVVEIGCATRELYSDNKSMENHSRVLIRGTQTLVVSNGRYFLEYQTHAYSLHCSKEEFSYSDKLIIYLSGESGFPTSYQLNHKDELVARGTLAVGDMPLIYSIDSIAAEVVSNKFVQVAPKSIYFKYAMTPFAIAFDAAAGGGLISAMAMSDPRIAIPIIQAVSK